MSYQQLNPNCASHLLNLGRQAREILHKPGAALSQINLGIIHYQQGELSMAEAAFRQALTTLQNLGLVHRVRGEMEAAEICFRQSLAAARDVGDWQGEGQTLTNLGLSHKARGEHHEAERLDRASEEAYRALGEDAMALKSRHMQSLWYALKGD